MLLLPFMAAAQPGFGYVGLRLMDDQNTPIPATELRLKVFPFNFHAPGEEKWVDASLDTLGGGWLRISGFTRAIRLYQGDEVMEIWLDNLVSQLDQDLYVDSLPWRPGSHTLFDTHVLTQVSMILPGTAHAVQGNFLGKAELMPRRAFPPSR